ncbi:MAG: DUF4150 domain-containing protein [Polyangiaceae bacterium]
MPGMFWTTKAGGMCMATPDTCKTPSPAGPVPVPYPNISQCNQATASTCSQKVKVQGMAPLDKDSEIPTSSGDEAGSAGGVVSGKIKGETTFVKFSAKVKVEGKNAVYQTCTTAQNGKNANAQGGLQPDPSQTKVMVAM